MNCSQIFSLFFFCIQFSCSLVHLVERANANFTLHNTPYFLLAFADLFPGSLFWKWRDFGNKAMVSLNV